MSREEDEDVHGKMFPPPEWNASDRITDDDGVPNFGPGEYREPGPPSRFLSSMSSSQHPSTISDPEREVLVLKTRKYESPLGMNLRSDPEVQAYEYSEVIYPFGPAFKRPRTGWTGEEDFDFIRSCIDWYKHEFEDGRVISGRALFSHPRQPGRTWVLNRFKNERVQAWLETGSRLGIELKKAGDLPDSQRILDWEDCKGGVSRHELDKILMRLLPENYEVVPESSAQARVARSRGVSPSSDHPHPLRSSPPESDSHDFQSFTIPAGPSNRPRRGSRNLPRPRPQSPNDPLGPPSPPPSSLKDPSGKRRSSKPKPEIPQRMNTFMSMSTTPAEPDTGPDQDKQVLQAKIHEWQKRSPLKKIFKRKKKKDATSPEGQAATSSAADGTAAGGTTTDEEGAHPRVHRTLSY